MKWQDLSAPDDPEGYQNVFNLWPTKHGTYETVDFSTGTSVTASGSSTVHYAFAAKTLSSTLEWVVDNAKIWLYSSGSLADKTNSVTIGADPHMAQYGNVTICAMGTANPTVASTSGGNFSAIAGAPNCEIVVVQSNCALAFNTATSADGWAASDVGDYTNWSTGEAASGRIIATPGPITAAVAFGNDVLVFKENAIYRMTYVGGAVKWQVNLVWYGTGAASSSSLTKAKYQVVATNRGVAFNGNATDNSVFLFDGASPPVLLNPLTTIDSSDCVFVYNPVEDMLCLAPAYGSSATGTSKQYDSTFISSLYYYYNFLSGQWGKGAGGAEEDYEGTASTPRLAECGVLQGDYYARAETSSKPVYWRYRNTSGGAHYRCAPSAPGSSSTCYVLTKAYGNPLYKTQWSRLTPILRRRNDKGTDTATLEYNLFRERHDIYEGNASVASAVISESSQRKRFDFMACDNYARFLVKFNALDVEIDGFHVTERKPSGTD